MVGSPVCPFRKNSEVKAPDAHIQRPACVSVAILYVPLFGIANFTYLNIHDDQAFRAAFDPRVLSAVCFFATDIHSATLGAGGDDSLDKVRKGDLTGKGELVVSIFSPVPGAR
jgi:hypothetical protein